MFGRIGIPELIIVLVNVAIIAGIIYAVLSLIRHFRNISNRLEKMEKKLDELTNKEEK